MSLKISPLLFNTVIYNNSKWFNKKNNKFSLNEDLQIREIINIIFKNNITKQYLYIDKIIFYKYHTKIKIYLYFFCNFNYFKINFVSKTKTKYLNILYLYYKYTEILLFKKLEIIKLLSFLKSKNLNIYIYYKNINYKYNSINNYLHQINKKKNYKFKNFKSKKINLYKYNLILINNKKYNNLKLYKKYKNIYYKKILTFLKYSDLELLNLNKLSFLKLQHRIYNRFVPYSYHDYNLKTRNYYNSLHRFNKFYKKKFKQTNFKYYFLKLKYFKTLRFILYNLCFNKQFINKCTIESLLHIIYYELDNLNQNTNNYNFCFYNIFNAIRAILTYYLQKPNCNLYGLRIQIKGRYLSTTRKRIFIFNIGKLNLRKINLKKDYAATNLIKITGTSSIKIWVVYKTKNIKHVIETKKN